MKNKIKATIWELRKAEARLMKKSEVKIRTGFIQDLCGSEYLILTDSASTRTLEAKALRLDGLKFKKLNLKRILKREQDAGFWKRKYLELKDGKKPKTTRPKTSRRRKYHRIIPVLDSRGRLAGHCKKHKKYSKKCRECKRQWKHRYYVDHREEWTAYRKKARLKLRQEKGKVKKR